MPHLAWIINVCENFLHSGGFLLEINISMLCKWQILKESSLRLSLHDSTKDSHYLVLGTLGKIRMEDRTCLTERCRCPRWWLSSGRACFATRALDLFPAFGLRHKCTNARCRHTCRIYFSKKATVKAWILNPFLSFFFFLEGFYR